MAAIAAALFFTATICVIVPLVTGNKIGFLDQIVDGIHLLFRTDRLSTNQMVVTELLVLVPLVFTLTAAILLFDNHGKQWIYRLCYLLLIIGTLVPGLTLCIFCKALYGQRWLMLLFVTIVVILLYVLLSLITWLMKVEDTPGDVVATDNKDDEQQLNNDQNQTKPEQVEQTDKDEQVKLNRRKVKQIQILQDLHDEKRINNEQYIALVNYVMNKKS